MDSDSHADAKVEKNVVGSRVFSGSIFQSKCRFTLAFVQRI